ncbi:glutathione S-transferase family protein [Azospirillum sp. CT11-132]|uniref:glutathione S-transferase family protein n=1 Tax=Azospirillum sp. CT11-132 TaxID=3396317 RepID=UPI0039A5A57C
MGKGSTYQRIDINLANKPDRFLSMSPTGKTPLLRVRVDQGAEHILFESAVIAEYLDEIAPSPLLPADPLVRARHRAWVEFASSTLADIAKLYTAPDQSVYQAKAEMLRRRFTQVEPASTGPWFGGERLSLVDAAFTAIFRYWTPSSGCWGCNSRPTSRRSADGTLPTAVSTERSGRDHPARLDVFMRTSNGHLAVLWSQ